MVNALVERATSDFLVGPDWALNIHISEICNRDHLEAKDVIRGIRKRIGSKNPKVQLLALSVLETVMQNCGDFVHMYVVEKDVLSKMVKIVRKKPDPHVREKILILLDTWQEAFGGARSRYPQYFAAYEEMLYMGLVFPKRSMVATPMFTPPHMQPHSSYPHKPRSRGSGQEEAESSAEPDYPTLSLTEIQNARGVMDVLEEMLNAIKPENKEELKQEILVELVEQCRTYKQRVVHLVNSTSDESLLCQGLALNDGLQRLLAKHEELSEGSSNARVVDAPLVDTGNGEQNDAGTTSKTVTDPHSAAGKDNSLQLSVSVNPMIDLLSGDDFNTSQASQPSQAEDSLAIVPVEQSLSNGAAPQQDALALFDMFSENNIATLQQPQTFQSAESINYPDGNASNMLPPHYEQSLYVDDASSMWNAQIPSEQQQQPHLQVDGSQSTVAFPPPPWEEQLEEVNSSLADNEHQQPYPQGYQHTEHQQPYPQGYQHMENEQATNMYIQQTAPGQLSAPTNQSMNSDQMVGYPLPFQRSQSMIYPQQMHYGQMGYMYPQQMYNNQMQGYDYGGYSQPQNDQYLDQRMSGLSVRDDGVLNNSTYPPPQSYVPSGKPSKPEDRLFGDLVVDFKKFKPTNTGHSRAESM